MAVSVDDDNNSNEREPLNNTVDGISTIITHIWVVRLEYNVMPVFSC